MLALRQSLLKRRTNKIIRPIKQIVPITPPAAIAKTCLVPCGNAGLSQTITGVSKPTENGKNSGPPSRRNSTAPTPSCRRSGIHGQLASKYRFFLLLGNGAAWPWLGSRRHRQLQHRRRGISRAPCHLRQETTGWSICPSTSSSTSADNMFIANPPEEHAKSNEFLSERLDWTLDMLSALRLGPLHRAQHHANHPPQIRQRHVKKSREESNKCQNSSSPLTCSILQIKTGLNNCSSMAAEAAIRIRPLNKPQPV